MSWDTEVERKNLKAELKEERLEIERLRDELDEAQGTLDLVIEAARDESLSDREYRFVVLNISSPQVTLKEKSDEYA